MIASTAHTLMAEGASWIRAWSTLLERPGKADLLGPGAIGAAVAVPIVAAPAAASTVFRSSVTGTITATVTVTPAPGATVTTAAIVMGVVGSGRVGSNWLALEDVGH